MDVIYLDNAATTPILPDVVDAMHQTLNTCYGNPSSVHAAGRSAKVKVESARKYIAKQLGVLPQEATSKRQQRPIALQSMLTWANTGSSLRPLRAMSPTATHMGRSFSRAQTLV